MQYNMFDKLTEIAKKMHLKKRQNIQKRYERFFKNKNIPMERIISKENQKKIKKKKSQRERELSVTCTKNTQRINLF